MAAAALLFDLDGTLADTAPQLYAAAAAALAESGCAAPPLEEARSYIGDGMPRFLKRMMTRQWWGEPPAAQYEEMHARFARHYQQRYADSPLYEGVAEALAALAARSFKMACVTNKAQRYTAPLLHARGLAQYFEVQVCGDTLPTKKPDPAPLRHAAAQLGAARAIMVGDSIADSRAAAAAGYPFICVRYGYHRQRRLPPADATADCFADIPALLDSL